jgi:hypothetical protein
MTAKSASKKPPDFNDPFAPDIASTQRMTCMHCGKHFEERQVSWEFRHGQWLWWCPIAGCDGAGIGFDILPEQ